MTTHDGTAPVRDAAPPRPVDDSFWVVPGRLLVGAHPGSRSRSHAMDRLRRFLDAGVTCFVDLTEVDEIGGYESLLPSVTPYGRRVEYLRVQIVDHGVPSDDATMVRILDLIDEALDRGDLVYLHCRAGVGRSVMTAACWLADHAGSGERGLAELALRWPQAAQSRRWPVVPETDEQTHFVRQWTPRRARAGRAGAAAGAAPALAERLLGGWLGLALGDALGAAGAGGGTGSSQALEWTQHTALALCSAESLLGGGFDARDQIVRFVRWQKEGHRSPAGVPGEGRATPDVARALATFLWRGLPMAGSHDPSDAAATSLPRMYAAAACACDQPAEAVALGAESSRTTHQSPLILDVCRVYTGMLVGVLRGDAADHWLTQMPPASAQSFGGRPVPVSIRAIFAPGEQGTSAPGPAGVTQVLGEVRRIVATTDDFVAGVAAASRQDGKDAALYGALAGTLLGARVGADRIPPALRSRLTGLAQLEQIAGLCLARVRDRGGAA